MIPVLLEARVEGKWRSIRIAREFPNVRAAMASMPMFARQQKVHHADARMRVLRTVEQIRAALTAVAAYNTRGTDV